MTLLHTLCFVLLLKDSFTAESSHSYTARQKWEVYAIKEIISEKDDILICPNREYRLQDPETITSMYRQRDDSTVTSVLEMVRIMF